MQYFLYRIRRAVRVLGNDGALANVHQQLATVAAAHEAVDLLESQMAAASPARDKAAFPAKDKAA